MDYECMTIYNYVFRGKKKTKKQNKTQKNEKLPLWARWSFDMQKCSNP